MITDMESVNKEEQATERKLSGKEVQERKRKRNIVIYNVISLVIVSGAVVWTAIVYFHLDRVVYTNDAQVESYINPINTRIPGYIGKINFSEHQYVEKGDTLVTIDDREYKIQVELAQASLMYALAGKDVSISGQHIARNSENVSDANIEEVKAHLINANINYKRFENLVKDDAATQFQLDQLKSERDAYDAKYKSLMSLKRSSVLTTRETGARVTVADADIKRASASLELARLNLSYTVIIAPYDGIVGRKTIEEGQFVTTGQTLVSIVRGNEKWVTANYTESQLLDLRNGGRIRIHIDAIPGKTYYGKIVALSAATGSRFSDVPVDNSTGNFVKVQQRFPVKIAFDDQNKASDLEVLKAGMSVEVECIK
jgi:membrane fusion protein, multidrug efflux system